MWQVDQYSRCFPAHTCLSMCNIKSHDCTRVSDHCFQESTEAPPPHREPDHSSGCHPQVLIYPYWLARTLSFPVVSCEPGLHSTACHSQYGTFGFVVSASSALILPVRWGVWSWTNTGQLLDGAVAATDHNSTTDWTPEMMGEIYSGNIKGCQ